MKIAATTLGETGGDLLAQTLDVGYAVSSLLVIGLFLVSLVTQLKATTFHPALYWTVIVSTSTAGTTMSDAQLVLHRHKAAVPGAESAFQDGAIPSMQRDRLPAYIEPDVPGVSCAQHLLRADPPSGSMIYRTG